MSFIPFILLSTFIFAGIILVLTFLLSVVEDKVTPKGDCRISINNNDDPLVVPTGKTLLKTLLDKEIYLPSACGGKGTCALCKCQVLEGGGEILPTEESFLSRKEKRDHYRLACQIKVKNDIKISIPQEIFNIKKYECRVVSNQNVASFIKELVLELPSGSDQQFEFQPGAYIQIHAPEYRINFKNFIIDDPYKTDWDKYNLENLTAENDEEVFRGYSLANYPAEKSNLKLNVRIATPPDPKMSLPPGLCSSYIFNLKPGDKVTTSGPFGDFFIKDTNREMMYIGGGAGMAPLRSHIFHLFKISKTQRKVNFWYGARSQREIFYENEFQELAAQFDNFNFQVALSEPLPEDEWKGHTGFIHKTVFENYLKNHEEPEEIEYYLCGPPLMIEAVQQMLDSLGVPPEMILFDAF